MKLEEHFAREKKVTRFYKAVCLVFVPAELLEFGYPFYLLCADKDSGYGNDRILEAITYLALLRSTVVAFMFFVAMVSLKLEIRRSYVWLIDRFMWRIYIIGVALSFCMVICLWMDYLTLKEARDPSIAILNTNTAVFYHWLEFVSNLIPGVAILTAYPAGDMFCQFNKFPE